MLHVDTVAQLDLPCAHGTIEQPLQVSPSGSFEWRGTYTQERPGPTRDDERGSPALYSGTLDGDTLKLAIRVGENVVVQNLQLQFGRTARIIKCA